MKKIFLLPAVVVTGLALMVSQFTMAQETSSPTPTDTGSPSISATVSPSPVDTPSPTVTFSPFVTATPMPTESPAATVSPTPSVSPNGFSQNSPFVSPLPNGASPNVGVNNTTGATGTAGVNGVATGITINLNKTALMGLIDTFPGLFRTNETVQIQAYNQADQLVFERTMQGFGTLWSMVPDSFSLNSTGWVNSMAGRIGLRSMLNSAPSGTYVVGVRMYNAGGSITSNFPNLVTIIVNR